ncbi:MAG: S-layer homology domain-containing protein [Clostridia bacterium]|nr:S-layer homology domain-containing protein [Clostridia bacterium]
MKNLKKVLALVVAMTMMLGTVGFAAYTDVDAEADIYTAVSTLSSLNILTGYDDGSFKPEGDITRAEFCAVVCRALGFNQEAAPTATAFSDVPAEHWASYYISTLADQSIVNGMGDGTFAPDANVTYEQAIKMLVVALGFEPMAAQKGGYPTGYLVVANTYEMTEGIKAVQNAPATRGVVAQLTYNALDVPVMEQVSYGTENVWQILDGSSYGTKESEYKTLLTKLDVAKIEGVLTATAQNGSLKNNEISYKFHEDRVYGDKNWKTFINAVEADEYGYSTRDFTLADYIIDAADYLQLSSVIYLREISRGKYEVIALMPGETGSTVEIGLEDIDSVEAAAGSVVYDSILYYPSASSTKTSKYKIDATADYYFNYGVQDDFADFVSLITDEDGETILSNVDMEITLVENDGDSYFDAVMVKQYNYDIVKAIDADRGVIEGKNDDVTIELDDEEVAVVIVDANGEEITLEDIKEEDVIAYISEGGKRKNYDWIEIINLGESAVTGAVDETDAANGVIYVNATEYGVAGVEMPQLGDEGTFYLTKTGKVFFIDTTASVSGNYAYVLDAAYNDADFTSAWQLKLLTKDNEVVIYTVRDTLEVDDEDVSAKTEECDFLAAFAAVVDADEENDIVDGADLDKGAHRVITFKLDSKNKIREINTVNATSFTDKEYSADAQVLGADLADKAVIFNISATKSDNYYATDISALVDEAEYSGLYITNANDDNDCVIITEGGSLIDYTQDIAVIASVTDIKLDEGATDAKKIRYYTSEEDALYTLTVVEEDDVTELVGGTSYGDITEGALIMFAADAEGTASAIVVIAYLEDGVYTINETAIETICEDDDDNAFIVGTIDDIKTVSAGKKVETTAVKYTKDGEEDVEFITIKGSANAYTYQNRNGKTVIHVGDWRANNVEAGEGYIYIARLLNNTVNDIVTNSVVPAV